VLATVDVTVVVGIVGVVTAGGCIIGGIVGIMGGAGVIDGFNISSSFGGSLT